MGEGRGGEGEGRGEGREGVDEVRGGKEINRGGDGPKGGAKGEGWTKGRGQRGGDGPKGGAKGEGWTKVRVCRLLPSAPPFWGEETIGWVKADEMIRPAPMAGPCPS